MTEAIETRAVEVPHDGFAEADDHDRRVALADVEADLRKRIETLRQAMQTGRAAWDDGQLRRLKRMLAAVRETRELDETGARPQYRQGALVLSGPDARELHEALSSRPALTRKQEQQHAQIEGALLTVIDVAEQHG